MIYLVANTKGGVGKTTIAVHLATWLAQCGRKTLLIDADRQASAASWASWRRDRDREFNPKTVMLHNDLVFKEGRALSSEYDDTVIDAGGRDDAGMRYALLLADRLIVPISHSDFDTAAWDDMEKIIEGARINNPRLEIFVALNRIHTARRAPIDLYAFMTERGYKICDTVIPELSAFVQAINQGLAVFEIPKSERASVAIEGLFSEVVDNG